MPINKKKMLAMKKEYGPLKGEKIYYALENKITKNKPKVKSKRKK